MAHFDASAIGALQDTQRPPYAGDSTPHFGQAIDLNWDSDYALKLAARPANPCVLRSFAGVCGRRISIVCREVLGFGDYRQRADPGLQSKRWRGDRAPESPCLAYWTRPYSAPSLPALRETLRRDRTHGNRGNSSDRGSYAARAPDSCLHGDALALTERTGAARGTERAAATWTERERGRRHRRPARSRRAREGRPEPAASERDGCRSIDAKSRSHPRGRERLSLR